MSTASRRSKTDGETSPRRSRSSILASTASDSPSHSKPEPVVRSQDERSVKDFLREKGYSYIRGIYLGEEDHGILTYVKASVLGIKVYIDLDMTYTDIKADDKDLGVKRASLPSNNHLSANEKAERCASMGVCGTAWECEGGLCMERRNEKTLDIEEDAFHIANGSAVFEKDDGLAYSIVRISDIIKDNIATVTNIQNAAKKHEAKAKERFLVRKLLFKTEAERLYKLSLALDDTMEDAYIQVEQTIKVENARNDYLEFPPNFHQLAEFEKRMAVLEDIHGYREYLVTNSGLLESYTTLLQDMIKELTKMGNDIIKLYL